MNALECGTRFLFRDWPNPEVPLRCAGVYTIWRGDEFIYVGMSGRAARLEDFVSSAGDQGKAKGLWTRLTSHASGRRSGDQFNVYVCDRFVVSALTPDDQQAIGAGQRSLDQMTKRYIHDHLSYRFEVFASGADALRAEREVRRGVLSAGRPFLNPL